MSSLALFLLEKGVAVSGSDREYSDKTALLSEKGCDVWIGVCPEKIGVPDLTVYTGAVTDDNAELVYCKENSIPYMERRAFLGKLSEDFAYTVAVAGTHGKTTVTAMLTAIFDEAKEKFYAHIGGDSIQFGNCLYTGDRYFITEACEYRKSLLSLSPNIGIVLNAESDHPDTYKNLSELYDTFDSFLENSARKGFALTCGDTDYFKLRQAHGDTVSFGFDKRNRFTATDVYEHKKGFYGFRICEYGQPLCDIKLSIAGKHNVINALGAFCAAYLTRMDVNVIASSLGKFCGVKRRFEKISMFMGAVVYSDYAHHPAEIRATLNLAKSILKENKKLYVVFQPHTYSRTAMLYNDFVKCFTDSDFLIICKEYPARETPDCGVDAYTLYRGIDKEEKAYCDNYIDAAALLIKKISPDDIICIIGAGDIVNLCSMLRIGADKIE